MYEIINWILSEYNKIQIIAIDVDNCVGAWVPGWNCYVLIDTEPLGKGMNQSLLH